MSELAFRQSLEERDRAEDVNGFLGHTGAFRQRELPMVPNRKSAGNVRYHSRTMPPENVSMDTIVNLCKRRGIVLPNSEIYGGLRSSWDYGPLGVELKNNVKRAWWRWMVQLREDVVGLDSAIRLSPRVWEASGHLEVFTDPLVECLNCHQRFRADHLPGFHAPQSGHDADETVDMAKGTAKCPNCGNNTFTDPR